MIYIDSVLGENAQAPSGNNKLNVVVSNVCDYFGQYLVSNGPLSTGLTPSLANAGCVGMSAYTHFDSLHASGNIRFLEVTDDSPSPNWQKLFYVASSSIILSYYSSFPFSYCDPVIVPYDTLTVDSISGIAAIPNQLFVIRESAGANNFLVFDTVSATPVNSLSLAMTPKFIDINYNRVAVVGTGLNNETILKVFNTSTLALVEDTVFNSMADNPISIFLAGSQMLYMASQPGDSVINVTKFNMNNHTIISATGGSSRALPTSVSYPEDIADR